MSICAIVVLALLGTFVAGLGALLFMVLCCMAGDFGYYDWPEHRFYRKRR